MRGYENNSLPYMGLPHHIGALVYVLALHMPAVYREAHVMSDLCIFPATHVCSTCLRFVRARQRDARAAILPLRVCIGLLALQVVCRHLLQATCGACRRSPGWFIMHVYTCHIVQERVCKMGA